MQGDGVWRFTLYVYGQDSRARRALERIRDIGNTLLGGRYELDVVDVLRRPELAEAAKVWVTPTLVREAPAPCVHIVGDLTDVDQVLRTLDVTAPARSPGAAAAAAL